VTLVDSVAEVVAPVIASLGIELVDVEHQGGVVRLVVDEPGGIGLDRVAEATRAASRALDLADPIPGRYTLEVSSPGLERPLRQPAHFARAVGQKVSVRARASFEGERRLVGTLLAAEGDRLVLRTEEGAEVAVPYEEVDRAKTVFDWGPAPKPGKVGSRPKGKTVPSDQHHRPAAGTTSGRQRAAESGASGPGGGEERAQERAAGSEAGSPSGQERAAQSEASGPSGRKRTEP